jgi:hypothetical protein
MSHELFGSVRQFASWDGVVGDERGHHFGGEFEGHWLGLVAESSSNSLVPPIMPIYEIRREVGVRYSSCSATCHVENAAAAFATPTSTRPYASAGRDI